MNSSEPSTSLPKSSAFDGLSSSTRVPLSSFTNNDTEPIIFNLPNSSTTTTTSITSCNCIGSIQTGCLPYDSRLQASTLEEAIASFPDLIRINHLHQPETMEEQVICETKECRDCQKEMRKKLASIGLLPAAIENALAAQGNNTNCTKYSFNSEGSKRKSKSDSSESKEDDEGHRKKKNKNTSEKYEKESKKKHDSNSSEEKKQKKHRRNRRQMTSSGVADPNLLGTRYILSCSQKGIDLDPSGFASFCSTCWVWRKLPDNYSPQYINELVCDNTDNSCLSGHATCNTGQHMVEVIRNDNGAQTRIALAAGSYCECKATMNSALISLIDGSGVSSTILPIGQMP